MKIFSALRLRVSQPPDPSQAWACLIANLLVLPGLGSYIAGRARSGCLQMILSLAGLGISAFSVIRLFGLLQAGRLLEADITFEMEVGGSGVGLFLAVWLWALFSSIAIVRHSSAVA